MKNLIKTIRIWLVHQIWQFLGLHRALGNIRRDITAIERKELDRDEQYPLEDRQALDIEVGAGAQMNHEATVQVFFRDGQRRTFHLYADHLDRMKKDGYVATLKFCHPDHGEMMDVIIDKKETA